MSGAVLFGQDFAIRFAVRRAGRFGRPGYRYPDPAGGRSPMTGAMLTVEDRVVRFAVKRAGRFGKPGCRYPGPAGSGLR